MDTYNYKFCTMVFTNYKPDELFSIFMHWYRAAAVAAAVAAAAAAAVATTA